MKRLQWKKRAGEERWELEVIGWSLVVVLHQSGETAGQWAGQLNGRQVGLDADRETVQALVVQAALIRLRDVATALQQLADHLGDEHATPQRSLPGVAG